MQRKYSVSRCIKSLFTSISATAGDGRLAGETSVRLKSRLLISGLKGNGGLLPEESGIKIVVVLWEQQVEQHHTGAVNV